MKENLYDIDNPGGGDCGPYAFGIALLPYLQQELTSEEDQKTPLWNKLKAAIPEPEYTHENIKTQIIKYDFLTPNKKLLNLLNITLRKILVEAQIASLEFAFKNYQEAEEGPNKNTPLLSNEIISDALGVFNSKLGKKGIDAKDNDFNRDSEFKNAIECFLEEKKDGKENPAWGLEFIKKNLLDNNQHEVDHTGLLVKVLNKKLRLSVWFQHNDFKILAEYFEVTFKTHGRGAIGGACSKDDKPVVLHINNISNVHWTTSIDPKRFPQLSEKIKEYNEKYNYTNAHALVISAAICFLAVVVLIVLSLHVFAIAFLVAGLGCGAAAIKSDGPGKPEQPVEPENTSDTYKKINEIMPLIKTIDLAKYTAHPVKSKEIKVKDDLEILLEKAKENFVAEKHLTKNLEEEIRNFSLEKVTRVISRVYSDDVDFSNVVHECFNENKNASQSLSF